MRASLLTDPSPPERFPELSFVAALALHDAVGGRIPGLAARARAEMAQRSPDRPQQVRRHPGRGRGHDASRSASASIACIIRPAPIFRRPISPPPAFAPRRKACSRRSPPRWWPASRNGTAARALPRSAPTGSRAPRARQADPRQVGRRRGCRPVRSHRRDRPLGSPPADGTMQTVAAGDVFMTAR